jgi:hypothetical protein
MTRYNFDNCRMGPILPDPGGGEYARDGGLPIVTQGGAGRSFLRLGLIKHGIRTRAGK